MLLFSDPARQNNGKATILCDTTRLLRDLIALIGSLKKENAALLNEFHYVSSVSLILLFIAITMHTFFFLDICGCSKYR
ncbi:Transcription factor bHLH47 [Platanthera zijinensis]|uniref:Transcription factor bHLH47 n=1 Tax=Platanthera zijinensis TaxID=2320716 RepID=A0AAP0G3P4_9ASPA